MNVQTINICDLLEKIFPGYWDDLNFLKYTYQVTSAAVAKWCKENQAHYYGRSKENFFEWEAIQEAEERGLSLVVLENFS